MDTEKEPLLQIEHLETCFFTKAGVLKAVDDVSITIPAGKTVGLVGESGCGKSMTCWRCPPRRVGRSAATSCP